MTNSTPTALNPHWREQPTLTVEQAALVLGISRWSAYELARRNEGGIPTIRLGRRLIVPTARLRALLGETNEMSATAANRDAQQTADGDGHDESYPA